MTKFCYRIQKALFRFIGDIKWHGVLHPFWITINAKTFRQTFKRRKQMRGRIGDLVIVRFDPGEVDSASGEKWDEMVGLVIGCSDIDYRPREYDIIYWDPRNGRMTITPATLPPSRLVRARPVNCNWDGNLYSLTIDKVTPVLSDDTVVSYAR